MSDHRQEHNVTDLLFIAIGLGSFVVLAIYARALNSL